jgi:tetratricopeptide (TPR) repeat protein
MSARRSATRAAALLTTAALALATTAGVDRRAAQVNNEANRLYEAGKLEDAQSRYEEAEQRAPDAAEILYNRGNAALRLGQPAEAASYLRRAAEVGGDPALRERSYYNLGNALHASGNLPAAAEAYRRALILDPEDRDAKINYEKVLRDQERNPEQQQQQPQQNNQQQDPRQQQQQGPQQGPRGEQGNEQEQEQQQQGDESSRPEEKPEETPPQPHESQGDSPPERPQEAATAGADSVAPGDLSREEALRILEALREQEKELQKERARKKAATRRVEKDW